MLDKTVVVKSSSSETDYMREIPIQTLNNTKITILLFGS